MRLPSNPELVRNLRAQLRPRRMVATAIICGALSLAAGYAVSALYGPPHPPGEWGLVFLQVILTGQVMALLIGGGIACLHAIQREKDLNTFDFQRITRLAPAELVAGKLLGAPALAYFIVLCLMPAALVGAVVGGTRLSFLLAAYTVLVLGCMTFQALSLLVSMLVERAGATVAVIFFIMFVYTGALPIDPLLALGQVTPFVAVQIARLTDWTLQTGPTREVASPFASRMTDLFFGWAVHHVFVLVILYVTFTAWFVLALVRNIKRDPAVYELYTPAQALGLAFYANLLLVGFFRWSLDSPWTAQATVLVISTFLFWVLGIVLLRNRDRLRRLQASGATLPGWHTALWPAPYLLVGTGVVGLAVVARAQAESAGGGSWDLTLGIVRVLFLGLWLVRDLLYLQWIGLRRGRRPLPSGLLYLVVFYVFIGTLILTLGLHQTSAGLGLTVALAPPAVLGLDPGDGATHWGILLLALGLQIVASGLFVSLQRRRLTELVPSPAVTAPSPA